MRTWVSLAVFVNGLLQFGHCLVDSDPSKNQIDVDNDGEDSTYDIRSTGDIIKNDDGLVVTTINAPEKCVRQANVGDALSVHYVGRFDSEDGEVFESSRKNNKLFSFQLGAKKVIKCYEEGVLGMCKGETRGLLCPAHLAYGERGTGVGGTIPPNATLHFTVELVNIQDGPPQQRTIPICYERGKPRPCSEDL